MEPSETLSDFLARRRRELDQEEVKLRARLAELIFERDQLRSIEQMKFGPGVTASGTSGEVKKRKRAIKPGTIMDGVMKILVRYPEGLPASDILRMLNEVREDKFLARESLSPQLSRLRQAGYIELDGSHWRKPSVKQENN